MNGDKRKSRGRRCDSAIKSTHGSHRGPQFDPQQLHQASHNHLQLWLQETLVPSSRLYRHLHSYAYTPMAHVSIFLNADQQNRLVLLFSHFTRTMFSLIVFTWNRLFLPPQDGLWLEWWPQPGAEVWLGSMQRTLYLSELYEMEWPASGGSKSPSGAKVTFNVFPSWRLCDSMNQK